MKSLSMKSLSMKTCRCKSTGTSTLSFGVLIAASLTTLLFAARASAATPGNSIDFVRDVQPILSQHCYECHGPDEQEARLRLDARNSVMHGGDSGPLFEKGHADTSLLIARLKSSDEDERMPPGDEPLSEQQIALLSRWIDEGATWPDGVGVHVEAREQHWAYVKPERPPLPDVKNTRWPKNEIDRFVLARLEKEGLTPSPIAKPATLLRRVYLDLTGLPPTIAEVDAFCANPSPRALEAVVDRLLASPRFGEKWARNWLDLARYSDSNGYQADQLRDMWAYRDWVIDAMNADMPYDQFTIEQIAGDLLPNATLAQKIATGFHRTPTCNIEAGVDPEENRTNQVIDRVNTTGTVWLGTSLDCARCHSHKYDPFSQKEYYQIFAYFNNTPLEVKQDGKDSVQFDFYGPKMNLPQSQELLAKRKRIEEQLEGPRTKLAALEKQLLEHLPSWEIDLLAGDILPSKALPASTIARLKKILNKPANERSDYHRGRIKHYFLATRTETKDLHQQIATLEQELAGTNPDTTLVMTEMDEPRATNVFKRGDFLSPGTSVSAGVPAVLHDLPEDAAPTRLAFARWLINTDNPLPARVRVNHWWTELFGRGLVVTGEDFGTQGSLPTHPQLLDWLAVEFMEDGWSTKRMIKRIVMSATYQQSSVVSPDLLQRDSENELLARGPRFRLPAETIRDNGLAIAGLLSTKMGGPPVYPPQPPKVWRQTGRGEPVYKVAQGEDRFRRGVYVIWRRVAPYPSFVNFDAPDRTRCVVNRSQTNTPMQALTLMNDRAFIEMAQALAARVLELDTLESDEDRATMAFRLCVARQPKQAEVAVLTSLLTEERTRLAREPVDVDLLIKDARLPKAMAMPSDKQEWAAWVCVANALLNLDETISKE